MGWWYFVLTPVIALAGIFAFIAITDFFESRKLQRSKNAIANAVIDMYDSSIITIITEKTKTT